MKIEDLFKTEFNIINLTIEALEHLGIAVDYVDTTLLSFQYNSWPCFCIKVSPTALKIMLHLYQSEEAWRWPTEEFCLQVFNQVAHYPDFYNEHLLAGSDTIFMISFLSPPYGEDPLRQTVYQLKRFFNESLPRAKEYILAGKYLRNALGQDAHWGWTTAQERICKMNCWTDIRQFTEGLVGVADRNGRYGFLDAEAKQAIPCEWAYVQPFAEELAAVEDMTGHYGFIDRRGRVIIPCEWSRAEWFSEDRAAVMDSNSEWGYIDSLANLVIPCTWAEVEEFKNGFARVWDCENNSYIIDNHGRIIEAR